MEEKSTIVIEFKRKESDKNLPSDISLNIEGVRMSDMAFASFILFERCFKEIQEYNKKHNTDITFVGFMKDLLSK